MDIFLVAGRGFVILEDWSSAEGALLAAARYDAAHPEVLAELFQLYALLGKQEPARQYAGQAAAANPEDARVQYRVGLFWAGEGEVIKAREALTRAATLDPGNKKIQSLLDRISAHPRGDPK